MGSTKHHKQRCTSKRPFPTKEWALLFARVAAWEAERKGRLDSTYSLKPYPCRNCPAWHLTKRRWNDNPGNVNPQTEDPRGWTLRFKSHYGSA